MRTTRFLLPFLSRAAVAQDLPPGVLAARLVPEAGAAPASGERTPGDM